MTEETVRRLLECSVEQNPEIFGAAIAFEPFGRKPTVKAYCPYCYKTGKTVRFVELGSTDYHYFQRDWYHIPRQLKDPRLESTLFRRGRWRGAHGHLLVPLFSTEEQTDRRKNSKALSPQTCHWTG